MGVKVQNFKQLGEIFYVLLFGVMYLALRDFTVDPTKEQHHILCKPWKQCYGDHDNVLTIVLGRKHDPYTES
jgi:hypothetical protein